MIFLLELTYLFCIYSVLGWIVEVVYFYYKTSKFHKRGILHGAYCPLYGFSLAFCTALTYDIIDNFFFSFLVCTMICTVFELITGIVFDRLLKRKMWDYTGMKFNLGGYICLSFALIWGITATICIRYLNPLLLMSSNPTDIIMKSVFSTVLIIFMITDMFSFIKTR